MENTNKNNDDDDDWLNDFDEEKEKEKEKKKEQNNFNDFYHQRNNQEYEQKREEVKEEDAMMRHDHHREYYHHHNNNNNNNQNDNDSSTFDANAPSPIVKTTRTPRNENYDYSNTNNYYDNNNNNNNNNDKERPFSAASKPSDDTVDEWLNEETPPPPPKVQDNYAYYQQQGGRGLDARGHQEQHNYQREEYHSQATSASAVVQSDNTNFNGLFAGNDDDVAFFDTLGGAEKTMAAPPPPLVYAQRVESKGVDSISATNAPAVDDDFLNDLADVSNPPTQMYQQPTAAATIPPPPVTQPAVRAYEPPSEFGSPPPKMFTPPPPPPSISSLPVVQQQNSHAVAYEPPSDFGVPPLVPAQAAVAYEPPSDFGVPPLVPAQAAVAYEPPSDFGVPPLVPAQAAVAYEPPSDFGVPPPIMPSPQNQPQQFQQHNSSSHVSNSSIQAHAQPGTVRSPDGKPPHRCIAFGFGGTLATVSQAHENLFSLCTHSIHDMFRSSDDFGAREFVEIASDETFFLSNSENLMTDESLCSKCERLANNSSQTIGESEMWRILSLFLSRKKTFDSLRSFGEATFKAEVASVLHVQNRVDGSPSSLTSASVSERDASPAILIEIERQISIGNTIAALDIAHTHKLWNVAVRVARLTRDETIISDTCLRAIQETMQVGTPLRVLELLSIGRSDVAVKDLITRNNENIALSDRWREVIAMVSLNSNERDKTITNGLITLGDACRESNYLGIAHLCYLLSGDVWPNDAARMRLIGSNDNPCRDPRSYHRSLIAERIMLSFAEGKGSEALKASLSVLIPHQRMKVSYCVLLADFGHFHVALATLKNVQKYLKIVRDDSRSDSGVSVDVISAEAADLEKRIREKLGQGVIKGKIANVGKKIAGGLSRFVGGTVDVLFGGDDGDVIGSRGLDDTPPPQQFHQRSSSQDTAFQHQRYGSSSSLESVSNQPQQNPYHQQQSAAYESANHSRSHSLASLDEHGNNSHNNTGEKNYPPLSQTTYSGQQQQQQQQPGVPFKLVKSFSKLFSAAVPAPDKPYEGPKVAPQETAGLPENTFYYDENLKQWVDKSSSGAQSTAAEAPAPLAPPPTMTSGVEYHRSGGGIPNSLGANVGARYVSTFNNTGQPNFQQNEGANCNEFKEMRLE
ncbi:unnamed protein product [Bathycoccus prasinos]